MAKTPANAPAEPFLPAVADSNNLPAHLQGGRKAKVGNIDRSDLIIPRVKLLQALSPEVTTFDNARPGHFWHNNAEQSLGKEIRFTPIVIRKSYILWAPRGDDRGVLARANDGVHWDQPEATFRMKPKGASKEYEYKMARTVAESGLDQFGTLIPDDPKSQPAAALTYNMMFYFHDFPDLSPAVVLNTRSAVKKAKQLISKLEMHPVDHYGRIFTMSPVEEKGAEGPYWNYNYSAAGLVEDEATYNNLRGLFQTYAEADFRASDEGEEGTGSDEAGGGARGQFNAKQASKF